ncbi:MAG: hypothetical protein ACYSPI_15090, partial [Planctomycetota bacterium]
WHFNGCLLTGCHRFGRRDRLDDEALNSAILEHFNIFCSTLCRREDTAGKEEYAAISKYGESF